jgi:hypothetical protein
MKLIHVGKVRIDGRTYPHYRDAKAFYGSKYKPHQGKRECARRVRQMAASA